jgi:hypothetical protein
LTHQRQSSRQSDPTPRPRLSEAARFSARCRTAFQKAASD